MIRLGSAFLTLAWIVVSSAYGAECDEYTHPATYGESIETQFASSVFQFRTGTAYYIGGSPGYLLTAHHILRESTRPDQVCSDVLGTYEKPNECYAVKDVDSAASQVSLPGWDLLLLEMDKPLPASVRPFGIRSTWPGTRTGHNILGYPKTTSSANRKFLFATAEISQYPSEKIEDDKDPLSGKKVYKIKAQQYKGASGAPVINNKAFAWATATQSTSSFQQALGVPHDSNEFLKLIVGKTKPSSEAQRWIDSIGNIDATEYRDRLIYALDNRRRTLSGLDLLHIGLAVRRANQQLFYTISYCPLNMASDGVLDWNKLFAATEEPLPVVMAARIAEESADKYQALANSYIGGSDSKTELLTVAAKLRYDAAAYWSAAALTNLGAEIPKGDGSTRAYERALTSIFGPTVNSEGLIFFATDPRAEDSEIRSRVRQNLTASSRASLEAFRISENEGLLYASLLTSAIALTTSAINQDDNTDETIYDFSNVADHVFDSEALKDAGDAVATIGDAVDRDRAIKVLLEHSVTSTSSTIT